METVSSCSIVVAGGKLRPRMGKGFILGPTVRSEYLKWSSRCGLVDTNLTSICEDVGSIVASLSGLRIRRCHELWCGSQMRLRSGIVVAVV